MKKCPVRSPNLRAAAVRAVPSSTVILLAALMAVTSCAAFRKAAEKPIEEPRVSLESSALDNLSFKQADLLFAISIENPNVVVLKLSELSYSLFVGGERFLEGVQAGEVTVDPRRATTVRLPLAIRYEDLFKTAGDLENEESSQYRLEAVLRFDVPTLGEVRVPLRAEGDLPLLRVPSIGLVAIEVSRLDFTDASLALTFAVHNPNPLPFFLDRLEFELEVGGQSWAAGGTGKKVEIGGKGAAELEARLQVFTFFIGQTGYRMLLEGRPLEYSIGGTAFFSAPLLAGGVLDLPFDIYGTIVARR
jgi:LEA14-like dessication related protein